MSPAVSLKKPQNAEFLHGLIMLGIPAAVQSLLSTSMSAIDTLMVSSQGELAVAAVGVCTSLRICSAPVSVVFIPAVLCSLPSIGAPKTKGEFPARLV